MIAEWPGLVDACAPYEPIMQWGMSPDADDAYTSAYFHGLAYGRPA